MEEKSLKTSTTQRIVIIIIAILLVGSTILAYILIVLGNSNSSSSTSSSNDELIAELTEEYDQKSAEIDAVAKPLSDKYFNEFSKYKSEVKSYNATNANSEGLKTKDLKAGNGRTLADGDTDYFAYYLGWCPDGSIFDSSFNDNDNPTSLKAPLDPSVGLIEGWNNGIKGMKIGGIRQINMSGDLAYGDSQEICGSTGSPLHFIVLAIDRDEELVKLNKELDDIYVQLYTAYYGNIAN